MHNPYIHAQKRESLSIEGSPTRENLYPRRNYNVEKMYKEKLIWTSKIKKQRALLLPPIGKKSFEEISKEALKISGTGKPWARVVAKQINSDLKVAGQELTKNDSSRNITA